MPYLAPYLLKGYIEQCTGDRATAHDLNISYQLHLWGSASATAAADYLARRGRRGGALVAELLAERGLASWSALRCSGTYEDPGAVRGHVWLLQQAAAIGREVDALRVTGQPWPTQTGEWPDLLSRWMESTVGRFIVESVDSGLYSGADVVGIGAAYTPQILPSLLLARALKTRDPQTRIVLGGSAITHYLPEVLGDTSMWGDIDFVIPFEGEHSLIELLESINRGTEPPTDNVIWRDGKGIVHYRKDLGGRPPIQPRADFSDLEHLYPTPEPIYPLLTSKGCYWGKCAFCTHHEGYGEGYRPLSDDLLESSLHRLLSKGARRFYFVDEALPPRKLAQIGGVFARAAESSDDAPSWMAEARLERSFTMPTSVDLLANSGCRLLVNGIESGSQVVVDAMRKGIDLSLAEKYAERCSAAGIRTGWMFFIGFPGETEGQANETFAFIAKNREHLDFAAVGVFGIERGSPIWNDPRVFGVERIIDPDQAYPTHFDYVMTDGTLVDSRAVAMRRQRLFAAWPELRGAFTNALDRAVVMFLPRNGAGPAKETIDSSTPIIWWSKLVGKEVKLNLNTRSVEIVPNAH
jgi:hypothetical protein